MTLEVAYRLRHGEKPTADEYRARFPGQDQAIEQAFQHPALKPAPGGSDPRAAGVDGHAGAGGRGRGRSALSPRPRRGAVRPGRRSRRRLVGSAIMSCARRSAATSWAWSTGLVRSASTGSSPSN